MNIALSLNKFCFVFGRLWCLLVEKNKLKLIKMSISRCLCNLILLKLFQSSLMGLAACLKNNENIEIFNDLVQSQLPKKISGGNSKAAEFFLC